MAKLTCHTSSIVDQGLLSVAQHRYHTDGHITTLVTTTLNLDGACHIYNVQGGLLLLHEDRVACFSYVIGNLLSWL